MSNPGGCIQTNILQNYVFCLDDDWFGNLRSNFQILAFRTSDVRTNVAAPSGSDAAENSGSGRKNEKNDESFPFPVGWINFHIFYFFTKKFFRRYNLFLFLVVFCKNHITAKKQVWLVWGLFCRLMIWFGVSPTHPRFGWWLKEDILLRNRG